MYVVQSSWDGSQKTGTLTARNAGGCQRMPDKDNFIAVIEKHMNHSHNTDITQEGNMDNNGKKYVLRRLTPTECARLQGFPDWWVDGANGSDSAQYKLWGNGVALPCVVMIMENIVEDMKNG